MVNRRRRARGMTLIEVMIALLLGTIGLLGMLMLMLSLGAGSSFSRQLTEASVLTQSKLEELVSQTGVTLTVPAVGWGGTDTVDNYGKTYTAGTSTTGPYTRTWVYLANITDTAGTRRRIQCTVTWNDARGLPHTVTEQRDKVAQ